MADLGNLHFGVHLKDYTDAEADKIKKKLENLSVKLTIDGKNVNISHTDLIKKQIEDAVKSVSVQSVKVDTSAVNAQVTSALQGVNPQISVTLLKGSLGNDLQNYLNSRTFNVGISISKSDAQNAARTAFANVSVPVSVTISASAVAQQMRQSLANAKVKVGVEAKDVNTFIADVENKLKGKKIKVDVEPNQQHLVQAVKQSLQGVSVKAQVKVDVDAQAITRAVQSAINNANFTYNPSGKGGRGGANANSAASSQRNLGNAYHYAAQGAYQSARASVSLGRSLSTNIRIAGELGTALGNLASIFGVKDLLYGIVQIGGQLENQRIALEAILQDGGKATEMFSKIQSLAVKSPFGIMDLNQYTKQLSAYGIEYNELYDTMKRMADISAGVGVDMGRIILAFGQVKAAGFLKGTELRQFTEANIPMVEKLAEKFSLLERRIVSAGEVYDMISEKKVTFEDVKDVLWGLTDEGGMFNNMQEVLSESLASKWKNLSDAIDVMYGKMADGMMGSGLKALAEGLTELTKNWEHLVAIISAAGLAYVSYRNSVAIGSGAEAMGVYKQIAANKKLEVSNLRIAQSYRALTNIEKAKLATAGKIAAVDLRQAINAGVLTKEYALRLVAMKKLDEQQVQMVAHMLKLTQAEVAAAAAVKKSTVAMGVFKSVALGVWTTLKSLISPWTLVVAAFSAIGEAFASWKQKSDELKQFTKEVQDSATGSMQTIGKELDKLRGLDVGKLNDDELKTQINELTTLIKNEAPHWQSLLADVFKKDADGNFVRTAKEQLDGLIEKIKEVYEAKQMLSDNSGVFSDALDKTDGWFFNDSLTKNLQDYSKEIGNVEDSIKNLGSFYSHIQTAITKAAGANQEFLKESDGKSIQEKVKILSKYKEEFKEFSKELGKTNQRALSIINDYLSALSNRLSTEEWKDAASDIKIFTDAIWKPLLDRGYTLSNLDDVAKQFIYDLGKRLVTNAGDVNPTTIKDFWTEYLKNFGMTYEEFSVVPADAFDKNKNKSEYDPSKDEVAKLWKKRAEEIDKAVKMYDKWKEVEGDINAESRVKGADEFSNLFNGKYGFSLNLENPTEAYRHIQKQLNKNLSAQNEVYIALGVKVSDAELNDAKEKVKQLIDNVKTQAKEASEQWDLYKQLFELTGNREFAKSAFDKTHVWDEAALKMKSDLENVMKELKLDFDADFDISDKDAKELYGELYDSWKAIKDRIEKNGIELKVNTANAIKSTRSIEDEIKSTENQRDDELKKYIKGTAEYEAVAKDWEQKLIKLKGELYELSPEFKSLFVDTTGMASGKLYELWQKARNLVNLIRQNATRLVKNKNGEVVGRYYTKEDGTEGYIAEESLKDIDGVITKTEKKVSKTQAAFDRLWKSVKGKGDEGYNFEEIAGDVGVLAEAVAQASRELSSMFDALGNESMADAFSFVGDMFDGVQGLSKAAASFASGDVLGGIFGGVSAVTGIISSIASYHDKKLDRAIQKSQLEVQKLTNQYKNLEKTLERQLGSATAGQAAKMLDSLKKQREELQEQYGLEDDKKKTDKTKLEDYKQQIAELDDQIKYFYEDLASEQYGVDIKGWAGQMADALTEAFAKGEDAAAAFDKTVSEILSGLVKEMIAMEVIMPAMDKLRDYMFKDGTGIFALGSDGGTSMTEKEAIGLTAQLGSLSSTIGDAQKIWDAINEASNGALENVEGAEKSGLSKGIQSVTEDTADLLASYINGMRADLSMNRTLIEQLVSVDVPKMSYLAEAQLQQLQMVVANTKRNADTADRIYDLVNRVVDKGSNKLKI